MEEEEQKQQHQAVAMLAAPTGKDILKGDEMRFASLFQMGPPKAADYFAHHIDQIRPFLSFVWDSLDNKDETLSVAEQQESNLQSFLVWSQWMLCCARTPEEAVVDPAVFLEMMRDKHPSSSVCGATWSGDQMIVSCKDCGQDPTCAICMPCFKAGNHEGHDYKIHRSGGGVCDCGDPEAWSVAGFCSKHAGAKENLDPYEILQHSIVESCYATVRAVLDTLAEQVWKCQEASKQAPAEYKLVRATLENQVKGMVEWLQEIRDYGEAFANIIARELGRPCPFTENEQKLVTTLDLLFQAHNSFEKQTKADLHDFYVSLIPDYAFKRVFLSHLIKYYPLLFGESMKRKKDDKGILELSVQLFTVTSLTLELVKKERLLQVLLNQFSSVLSQAMSEKELVNCSSPIVTDNQYWRVYVDIKYVLTNRVISQYVCHHDPEVTSEIFRSLSLAHGTTPHVRQKGVHIESEEPWLNSVNLDLWLLRWIDELVHGFKQGPDPLPESTTEESKRPMIVINDELTKNVRLILSYIRITLELWWERHTWLFDKSKNIGKFSIIDFDVAEQPVSVQILLHRLLAVFLFVCVTEWGMDLKDILELGNSVSKLNQSFAEMLLEEPLRIQVMFGQVRAKMWVRNGWSMFNLAHTYECSTLYSHKSFHKDIFLLQVCAVMLDPEKFVAIFLERFKLIEWFSLNHTGSSGDENQHIAEHFLTVLLTVISDRVMLGATKKQVLHRYLVHRLCIKDHTHSQLMESIPKHWAKYHEFDTILGEVAIYQPPQIRASGSRNLAQGMYTLKTEYWKEFEGSNFRHYSSEELEQALSRFQDHCTKEKLTLHPTLFPLSHQIPTPSSFEKLAGILNCHLWHQVLFSILFKSVSKNNSVSHPLVGQCLQALHFSVASTHPSELSSSSTIPGDLFKLDEAFSFPSNNLYSNLLFKLKIESGDPTSILDLLLRMALDNDRKDFHPIISSTLKLLSEKDQGSKEIIDKFMEESGATPTKGEEEVEKEKKKKAAQARQQQILAQFAAQRKAFQSSLGEEEEVEEEETEQLELEQSLECCLCRGTSGTIETGPISLVSYAALSRAMEVANRQNQRHACNMEHSIGKEEKAEKKSRSEPLRNLDQTTNVTISNCGHYLHVECFQRYFSSLLKRHFDNQMYEGRHTINILVGEYFCPTCRTLSNALLPIVNTSYIQSGDVTSDPELFTAWKAQTAEFIFHANPSELPKVAPSLLGNALDALATSCRSALSAHSEKVTDEDVEKQWACLQLLWSTVASTVSNLEMSARSKEGGALDYAGILHNTKLMRDYYHLINAESHHHSHRVSRLKLLQYFLGKIGDAKTAKFCTVCSKSTTTRCSKCKLVYYCSSECQILDHANHKESCISLVEELDLEDVPLLSLDVFATLVRMSFCCTAVRDQVNVSDVLYLIRMLFPVVVMQSICSLALAPYKFNTAEGSGLPKEGIITGIYDKVRGICGISERARSEAELVQGIKALTLPFLRRSALFAKCCSLDSTFSRRFLHRCSHTEAAKIQEDEFSFLCSILHLETDVGKLLNDTPQHTDWKIDLASHRDTFSVLPPPSRLHLFPLDDSFEELLKKFSNSTCKRCGTTPKGIALCLLCGELLCVNTICCRDEHGIKECPRHMEECSGKGLFFLVKECVVFVARRREGNYVSGYFFHSLYLDKYGEEDEGFLRGKPLFLAQQRYDQLQQLWFSPGDIDNEVVKAGSKLYKL